ncbi:unnamed protein product, partial [Brenthis ino]
MLTIGLFIGIVILFYYIKIYLKNEDKDISSNIMEQTDQEQVRCSSSESDNFEKIDSEDLRNNANPHFIVGDEGSDVPQEDDGPSHEGGDSFPNAPPPNIRPKMTLAQQLALAEKRSKLR